MAGDDAVAQQIVYDACLGSAARLGGYRNHASAFACLLENIRVRAKTASAAEGIEKGETPRLARVFRALPEGERAALAMLYSGLLPAREIAQVLKLSLEEMGGLLRKARAHLQATPPPSSETTNLEAAL